MYTDEKMYEDQRDHFGMYHGADMYCIIKENDLWDLEYPVLRELTYAIRWITGYDANIFIISHKCFRWNLYKFYIDTFELWNFSRVYLLKLLKAVEELIEFKVRLKEGWPWL